MHHLGRMADAAVRHVGDVQQAVDAAQIDERAVFGQVLDHAGDDRALCEMLQGDGLAELFLLLGHGRFARNHHVAAAAVELDDLDRNVLPDAANPDCAPDAGSTCEPGMNALTPTSTARPPFTRPSTWPEMMSCSLMRRFQVVPDAQARGLRVREQHVAFDALAVIDHHVDHVAAAVPAPRRRRSETVRWEPGLRICIRSRR